MLKKLLLSFACLNFCNNLFAASLAACLGSHPKAIHDALGAPDEILSLEEGGMPYTVYVYSQGIELLWLENRVAQVKLLENFRGEVLGAFMGAGLQRVEAALNRSLPLDAAGQAPLLDWSSQDSAPAKAQLVFKDNRLKEALFFLF